MKISSFKTANQRNLVSLNRVLSSIAIIFSYLVFASIASAADYYATATGSGSSCTSSVPCSLLTAITKPVAGDTVHVAPGTYSYTSTALSVIQTNQSGTASARIRYVSDTKWGAKIVSSGTMAVWRNSGSYVDIEGFDISGDGAGGIYNYASYVRIIGNHVHDIPGPSDCANNSAGGAGIQHIEYNTTNNETSGNNVHDIGIVNCGSSSDGADRVHGIYHSAANDLIYNNISYHNSGYGIHVWHAAQNITISNNLSFNNLGGGFYIGAGDSPGGITCSGMVVTNNMAINNGRYGIIEWGAIGANTYNSNILYGNSVLNIYLKNGNTAVNTLNVAPSTIFVNYKADGSGDYHLSATSPAINAGTTQGMPTTDFDGLSRMGNTSIGPLILVPPSNLHVVQ